MLFLRQEEPWLPGQEVPDSGCDLGSRPRELRLHLRPSDHTCADAVGAAVGLIFKSP